MFSPLDYALTFLAQHSGNGTQRGRNYEKYAPNPTPNRLLQLFSDQIRSHNVNAF